MDERFIEGTTTSSPRPWRCFPSKERLYGIRSVFSTSVEVFLHISTSIGLFPGLLHVRGGVSLQLSKIRLTHKSSSRPWRCFSIQKLKLAPTMVFSTSVEVFPSASPSSTACFGLLHVRGGVSTQLSIRKPQATSSPRPWRCFLSAIRFRSPHGVFSTSVEVFEHFGSWRDCCLLT